MLRPQVWASLLDHPEPGLGISGRCRARPLDGQATGDGFPKPKSKRRGRGYDHGPLPPPDLFPGHHVARGWWRGPGSWWGEGDSGLREAPGAAV